MICGFCGKMLIASEEHSSIDPVAEYRNLSNNYQSTCEIKIREKILNPNANVSKTKVFAYDICSKCFKEKIIPFMKSNGINSREYEI